LKYFLQEEVGRRHGGANHGSVQLTFVLHLAQNTEVHWESVLWQGQLYLQVPGCLLPEGSKEGFVSILEYAEDVLKCSSVILCLKKDRSDRGQFPMTTSPIRFCFSFMLE
jgi:ornithine decarboxylase antizyme 1